MGKELEPFILHTFVRPHPFSNYTSVFISTSHPQWCGLILIFPQIETCMHACQNILNLLCGSNNTVFSPGQNFAMRFNYEISQSPTNFLSFFHLQQLSPPDNLSTS